MKNFERGNYTPLPSKANYPCIILFHACRQSASSQRRENARSTCPISVLRIQHESRCVRGDSNRTSASWKCAKQHPLPDFPASAGRSQACGPSAPIYHPILSRNKGGSPRPTLAAARPPPCQSVSAELSPLGERDWSGLMPHTRSACLRSSSSASMTPISRRIASFLCALSGQHSLGISRIRSRL